MSSLVVLLALSERAHAANLTVPGAFATLQAAVDASTAADVIILNADVSESVTISNKTVTIRGATVDNQLNGTIIARNNANVTISGMKMAGGNRSFDVFDIIDGDYCDAYGASGLVVDGADVTLIDVEMFCFSQAILATDATIDITTSDLSFNAALEGAAINASDSDVSIDNSLFSFNVAASGGAIYMSEANNPGNSSLSVSQSTFETNITTGGSGGAIYATIGSSEIWSNRFTGNVNLVYYTPGTTLENEPGGVALGLVVGLGDGGAVYLADSSASTPADVDLWNNTFCGNIADRGAGVYLDDIEDAGVYNNRFAENLALHYGGGLYAEAESDFSDPDRVVNNTFLFNTAGLTPLGNPVVIGGGGSVALVNTKVDFRNNIVAQTQFGAGVLGVADDLGASITGQENPDYTIGDLLTVEFNDFYQNCDTTGCGEGATVDFSGDMAQLALLPNNIHLDPFPVYFGAGDFDCFPDAFYPQFDSPVVRTGDAANEPNRFSPNFSDMGSYGGPRGDVLDRDGDGYENIYDCNDELDLDGNQVHPGAPEICDNQDNDCNGLIDEGWDTNWYIDTDGDGYGDVNQVQPRVDCNPPPNHVLNRDDCADNDLDINPGNVEICDGQDNDCDGVADGGLEFISLWNDRDNDGYGSSTGATYNGCPSEDPDNMGPGIYYVVDPDTGLQTLVTGGMSTNNLDCSDFDVNISPSAEEACDEVDNDCDGIIDNNTTQGTNYYPDVDGDGFGSDDETLTVNSCFPPTGGATYVTVGGDCKDDDVAINPGADEVCNDNLDNDCKKGADKEAIDAPTLFEDADGDGLGNPARVSTDCVAPPGYTATVATDCDDTDPLVKECSECGCQSTPTPGGVGSLGLALGLSVVTLRRRRA